MPLYEFHCNDCGKDSEILVRSSNWKGTTCPACQSTKLVKKLSVFAASVKEQGGSAGARALRPACSFRRLLRRRRVRAELTGRPESLISG